MRDVISRNSSRLELSMRVTEAAVLALTGEVAGLLVFQSALAEVAPIHTVLLYFCSGLAFLMFPHFGIYSSWRGRPMAAMFLRVASGWIAVLLIGVFFSFLIHLVGSLSRTWLLSWFVLGLGMLMACRIVAFHLLRALRKQGVNSKRVVIVGYGPVGREMHRRAQLQDWTGYEVRAIHGVQPLPAPMVDPLHDMHAIPAYVAAHEIDEIWITLPMSAAAELRELQYLLRHTLVDIRWMPDTLSMHVLSSRVGEFLGFPCVDLNRPVAAGPGGLLKDLFDRCFALLVLLSLAPLMAAIAVAIRWSSPGPILFRQRRLGLNGKPFDVYKFRSMKLHAEYGRVVQASAHDPRITPFGHFLRRTSLDELPQFFNVLRGEMSVVGPRPHAVQHNEQYKELLEQYMLRHRVKPGITGWAQIHGYRGETDTIDKMAMRVQFDLHYIRHWSLWMDLRIIAWTAIRGWSDKNAY